jgi:hypothetical protein
MRFPFQMEHILHKYFDLINPVEFIWFFQSPKQICLLFKESSFIFLSISILSKLFTSNGGVKILGLVKSYVKNVVIASVN